MDLNFDQEVLRVGTESVKWEYVFDEDHNAIKHTRCLPSQKETRLLPLWVADMDFECPPAVTEALVRRAQHGIYGYTMPSKGLYQEFIDFVTRRHAWTAEKEWIKLMPGVVPAIKFAIQAYTKPGESILIQEPVYHPFRMSIESNDRVVVSNDLLYENGTYQMDFDDLEAKLADPLVTMAILCSPHNPVGRVWTTEELTRFGEICLAHNVLVVSDEIHCDLIMSNHKFIPFAAISERFAQQSITCMAPSKTFNLAGLKGSAIIIPNAELRATYEEQQTRSGIYGINTFAMVGFEAAYKYGDKWLDQVLEYIEGNYNYLKEFLAKNIPLLKPLPLEGTYLVWVDCSALEIEGSDRHARLMDDAQLFFNNGAMFGHHGEQFERINIACPRPILAEALDRMCHLINATTA